MRIFNKISSIILALCMAVSLFAVPTYATTPVVVKNAIELGGTITDTEDELEVYLVIPEGISEIRGAQFTIKMPQGFAITDVSAAIEGWNANFGNNIVIECGQGFKSVEESYPSLATNKYLIATLDVTVDTENASTDAEQTAEITVIDITSGEGDGKKIYPNIGNEPVNVNFGYTLCHHIFNEQDYVYNEGSASCGVDGTETAACANGCGKTDTRKKAGTALSHTGGTATCVDKKVCTACGEAYGGVDENNHESKTNYKAVASTCTKKGSTAGFKCAACGVDTRKSVAVKDHTYSHDCDNTCNVCKKPIRKTSHSLSANYVSKKATEKANGIISKKCTKKGCGYEQKVSTIYKIKTIKLSKTTYTYTGKAITPSVSVKDSKGKTISSKYYTVKYASGRKSAGKYKVTVTFKGNYSGTKTLYFTIIPKATKISSLKAGKKAFTVKYSRQTSGSGYEIQYSTSSKFKSAKTVKVASNKTVSKTIKKLSAKKTYYVRVRVVKGSYKSAWSKVSKVKTK